MDDELRWWPKDKEGKRHPHPALKAIIAYTQEDYGYGADALDAVEPILKDMWWKEIRGSKGDA